jgi:hypothetical protein
VSASRAHSTAFEEREEARSSGVVWDHFMKLLALGLVAALFFFFAALSAVEGRLRDTLESLTIGAIVAAAAWLIFRRSVQPMSHRRGRLETLDAAERGGLGDATRRVLGKRSA